MKTRVAINGFGRIGRNAFRVAFDRDDIEIVAINDLTNNEMLAYLLKYDTNYGAYHHEVSFEEGCIVVDGKKVPVSAEKDPANLPWADRQVDVVIESTGLFVTAEKASAHIKAGAKKVVISAPAKDDETQTIVLGANEHDLESYQGDIISNASCTTNSLAAVMDILDQEYGIEKAMLTTVHSYTASQVLQDGPAKAMRESRAAAQNIVPSTTGAAIAVAKTVPSLLGKFDGMSVRVPTSVVSLSDVTMLMKRDVTAEEVNATLKKASKDLYYQGIVDYTDEELVSSDYIGNSHSGTVDGALTNVVDGNMLKVVVWYDNEWGYSNRLVELVADVGNSLHGRRAEEQDADVPVVEVSEDTVNDLDAGVAEVEAMENTGSWQPEENVHTEPEMNSEPSGFNNADYGQVQSQPADEVQTDLPSEPQVSQDQAAQPAYPDQAQVAAEQNHQQDQEHQNY